MKKKKEPIDKVIKELSPWIERIKTGMQIINNACVEIERALWDLKTELEEGEK